MQEKTKRMRKDSSLITGVTAPRLKGCKMKSIHKMLSFKPETR